MKPEKAVSGWTNPNGVSGRRNHAHKNGKPKLHCIADVIQRENVSPRTLAQRLDIPVSEVRATTDPTKDLTLSELYRWQQVLQVPISELLADVDTALSPTVRHRCQLLKAMRTVRSIQENSKEKPIQTMAQRLVEQLLDIMPELGGVSSWPTVGQRRTLDEFGAVSERVFPDHLFGNPPTES